MSPALRSEPRQEPQSLRIYLAMDPGPMRAAASDEERIAPVKAELARLDRGGWDRILVALPARRGLFASAVLRSTCFR